LPGKHISGSVGLARLLPARIRLSSLLGALRARSARRRLLGAAAVALLLIAGASVWTFSGPAPRFVTAPVVPAAPVGPMDEVAVSTTPMPEPSVSAAPSTATVPPQGSGPEGLTGASRPVAAPDSPEAPTAGSNRPATDVPTGAPTARYAVASSWDTGFIGGVLLTNPTGTALSWRVVVTHAPDAGIRVTTAWNAALQRSGATTVFTGGPLAPGASQTFGFEATKRVAGPVGPTACTVNGVACATS
jgi:hypothetical protein